MVKIIALMTAAVMALSIVGGVYGQCSNPVERKEWGQLSNSEKMEYVDAIKRLTARPISGQYSDARRISYHDFVVTHINNAFWAHANAQFYVYHRAMLAKLEAALVTVGWTKGLVYWDWSSVSQNWWEHDIFRYFGTQGTGSDRCLRDGEFSVGKYRVSNDGAIREQRTGYPGDGCLRRCGSPGQAVTDSTVLRGIFELATDFTGFRGDDTRNFHAVGHIVMGGTECDLGNFYFSPNDPMFFFHHAFVDKVWWKWQQLCPHYKTAYEGFLASGESVKTDDRLDGWGWTAGQMLDTTAGPLCYTYSRSAGDLPHNPNPGCRASTPSPSSPSGNGGNNGGNTPTNAPASPVAQSQTTTQGQQSIPTTTTNPNALLAASFGDNSTSLINFGSQGLWLQDLTYSLAIVKGVTPKFIRRDEEIIVNYANPKPTSAPITTSEESIPTLPATKPGRIPAGGFYYYSPEGTTRMMDYYATTTEAIPTLPTTTSPYNAQTGTSTTLAATSTPLPPIDPEYYAPKPASKLPTISIDITTNTTIVTCQNRDIPIPSGYVIHKAFSDYVVVVPEGYQHNASKPMTHGMENGPKVLRPPHSDEEMRKVMNYVRPSYLAPPPAVGEDDLERLRYPPTIPEEYIKGMGMDVYMVRKGERDAKYAIDRCNADESCKSPSALGVARGGEDLSFLKGLEVEGKGVLGADGRTPVGGAYGKEGKKRCKAGGKK